MDIRAEAKYIRMSPRKLRKVADAVKGEELEEIITNLRFIRKRAAKPLLKAINSAVANAQNNHEIERDELRLKSLEINEGPTFKRWRPVARGMAHPYEKKTSHIKIVLTDDSSPKS